MDILERLWESMSNLGVSGVAICVIGALFIAAFVVIGKNR